MSTLVSKLILGTVQLGTSYGINNHSGKPSRDHSLKILSAAQEHGIQFLDTANAYGDSQLLIKEFHSSHPPFKILSKFKFTNDNQDIRWHLDATLSQLGCEKLDTYSFHSFKDYAAVTDHSLLLNLKKEGIVENWGISIYSNAEFEAALSFDIIDVIQIPFNLLDNFNKRGELMKKAKSLGKKIHVRSVFLQGLFFKSFTEFPTFLEPLIPDIQNLHAIALRKDLSLHDLALLYPFGISEIDGILIGVDTLTQLLQNVNTLKNKEPSDSLIADVNAINCNRDLLLNPSNWSRL